jgi:hypothetical protein
VSRYPTRAFALVPLVAALVAGCAAVGPHPDDAGDVCATQRAELRGAQDYYTQAVVKGAVVGGLVGGLTGWLVGDSGKSAAIGAAAGAVAGGVGGYYLAKQQTASDAAALGDGVLKDVAAENQEIDRTTIAFAKLRDCRFAAARQVKADYAAKRITRAEAVSRLDALKRQFDADLVIAEQVGTKMGDRAKEFQYASDQLVSQDPEARAYVAAQKKARGTTSGTSKKTTRPTAPASSSKAVAVAQATETNQVKQKAFSDEVAVARNQAPSAFALEGQLGWVAPPCGVCGAA